MHLCTDKNGDVIDPWRISFQYDDIDAVFKRFYLNHCQMQILFNENVNKTWGLHADEQLWWDVLWNVTQFLFVTKPPSLSALKQTYVDLEHKLRTVKTQIKLVQDVLAPLPMGDHSSTSSIQYVLIAGDAAMTAHYRLGVGINTILDGFAINTDFFEDFASTLHGHANDDMLHARQDIVRKYNTLMHARLLEKAMFQNTVIFLESYCRLLVFFDFGKPLHDAMILFRRNFKDQSYERVQDASTAIRQCIHNT
ncbi:hypothetical protein RFI_13405 [Reticulomyxa filosa]|uniref:Uncharacterized protein n=1 Tax=Reticulomyxa filosa TaxID=46433 RepID=X6NDC0_RETFI|nr:hypothetical protein RFI_13405 [Reticulomyxa filosa]|eukprot:ETO23769.1 hypothetical protein RFI_13405 [Reticulomyxa filosa]